MNMNRRQFLKSSSAFAAPLILAPGCATKFCANRKVNIGVIGYGRIAHTMDVPLCQQYVDLCEFVAVADLDSKRREYGKQVIEDRYAKKYGVKAAVKTYADYHELLADPAIDAVMLCIPDHQHAIVATDALLAGKHIWLQKPFAQTIQEGRIIANVAKMKNLVVQVASAVPQGGGARPQRPHRPRCPRGGRHRPRQVRRLPHSGARARQP